MKGVSSTQRYRVAFHHYLKIVWTDNEFFGVMLDWVNLPRRGVNSPTGRGKLAHT